MSSNNSILVDCNDPTIDILDPILTTFSHMQPVGLSDLYAILKRLYDTTNETIQNILIDQ